MLVATVIMAVAIVGLLSGLSGALRNAARLTDRERAVQLARLRMNDLLVDQRLPRDTVVGGIFDPSQSGGLEAGWRAHLSTFERPPSPAPGEVALDRVELEIWWDSGGRRRTFVLDGYRPHVLTPAEVGPVVKR